jgi:hypothetical protein
MRTYVLTSNRSETKQHQRAAITSLSRGSYMDLTPSKPSKWKQALFLLTPFLLFLLTLGMIAVFATPL